MTTVDLALRLAILILEGFSIEQRQVLAQRFINDTGVAREKWDKVVAWFVGLLAQAAAKDAK